MKALVYSILFNLHIIHFISDCYFLIQIYIYETRSQSFPFDTCCWMCILKRPTSGKKLAIFYCLTLRYCIDRPRVPHTESNLLGQTSIYHVHLFHHKTKNEQTCSLQLSDSVFQWAYRVWQTGHRTSARKELRMVTVLTSLSQWDVGQDRNWQTIIKS